MSDHPISDLMSKAMENIKGMVDVNTIVGEAVTTPDGTVIIPISKVSFGFAAGGSDFAPSKNEGTQNMFGGGSGAGVSIVPMGFLTVTKDQVKLLPVSSTSTPLDKLVDCVPDLINKVYNSIKSKADSECAKDSSEEL